MIYIHAKRNKTDSYRGCTKKIVIFLMVLFCALFLDCNISKAEENKELRTVRVGCSVTTGYHQVAEQGGKVSGYGYMFEQVLAQYAGWKIEYVEGTWKELQDKLKKGEIDLLGYLVDTPERRKYFDFSRISAGTSMSCLVTQKNSSRFSYRNYKSFDGMTVACIRSNANEKMFMEYAKEHHFRVKLRYFDTYEEVFEQVNNGKVESALVTSYQDLSNYGVMDQFLPTNFYYAVKKGETELLEELNDSLEQINSYYSDFGNFLYEQCFDSKNGKKAMFTEEEKEYMAKHPVITVVPGGRNYPYETYDEAKGTYVGIVPDILQRITKMTGIRFQYLKKADQWVFQKDNLQKNYIMCMTYDVQWAKDRNVYITQPFMKGGATLVCKDIRAPRKSVAVIKNRYLTQIIKKRYPEWKQVFYQTKEECLDAVLHNDCDCAVLNSYECEYYKSEERYNSLQEEAMPGIVQDTCLGLRTDSDKVLYSILSKSLMMLPSEDYTSIVRENVAVKRVGSIEDYIYSHPIRFTMIVIAMVTISVALIALILYSGSVRKKNAEIVKANQAKSDFLSRVSHDLRTPMNTIINLTQIVADEIDDREAAKADLKKIQSSNQFLLSLINDVLDMSKVEEQKIELHPERYSYEEFLNYLHSTFDPLSKEKNIQLDIIKGKTEYDILIDKVRFNQVCFNLLSNAIKYTPEGGHVEFLMQHGEVTDGLLPCDIYVKDDGVGMSKEFQEKMFEPFSQEGRIYQTVEGTGLGLSIVKEIVNLLGGTIDVQSEKDIGTTFHIQFMMKLADGKETYVKEESVDLTKLSGKQVLLVEDHLMNQEIAKRLLENVGIETQMANDGEEAVALCQQRIEDFDFILMDIRMPRMDGYEATKRIRQLPSPKATNIPIIAMTANAYAEDVNRCIEAGMNAHVAKPIEPKKLYKELEKQLL